MRASGYERVASDWYCEPSWVVSDLLKVETIDPSTSVWDPSCGSGNIPKTLISHGIECFGSDIEDRGYGERFDFFARGPEPEAEVIISNPPYGVIEQYVDHALRLATDRVILLARLAFLEGMARQAMFRRTPLARIWVSSKRVSMPPGGSDIEAKGGSIAYAWFVWERGHVGPAATDWLPIAPSKNSPA